MIMELIRERVSNNKGVVTHDTCTNKTYTS